MMNKIQNMEPEQLKAYIMDHLSNIQETQAHETEQIEPVKQRGMDMEYVEKTGDALPTVPAKALSSNDWEISLYEMEFQKRIGRGSAGTTYLAKWSGQDVAVKVAAITEMGVDGWNNEIQSLQRLHHPNIIRLLGSIYNPSPLTYCLVLEYCDAGDLAAALKRRTPPNFFFRVASSVASGMAYLHSRNVLHRDIKVRFHLSLFDCWLVYII
jgi:serine/threonine protein kinase